MAASRQDCFNQAIQVNHLTLPAGTTTEQAFAKYEDCVKDAPTSVSVGGLAFYGDKQNAFRRNCFSSALKSASALNAMGAPYAVALAAAPSAKSRQFNVE